MGMQVVLTLSDDFYERAKQWAARTQRDVPQTVADALEIILTPVQESPAPEPAVTMMSDIEVMALTQVQMAPRQGGRLDDRILPVTLLDIFQDSTVPARLLVEGA